MGMGGGVQWEEDMLIYLGSGQLMGRKDTELSRATGRGTGPDEAAATAA